MGLTLKAWRVSRDLTQEDMAKKLGVDRLTYRKWELNPDSVKIEKAKEIAEILDVPVSDIFFA